MYGETTFHRTNALNYMLVAEIAEKILLKNINNYCCILCSLTHDYCKICNIH